MIDASCPGASKFKDPKPESAKCSSCGYENEIWTDEFVTKCKKCGEKLFREGQQTCLDWCKYARQCVGSSTFNAYVQNKTSPFKQKFLKELEDFFGDDKKRINHAKSVLSFAEEILKREQADWHIVVPSAIFHDVGIKIAEQLHGSSDAKYQEKEGPAIAKKILEKHNMDNAHIDEICGIIANHHSPGKMDTLNFRVLLDADLLENSKEPLNRKTKEEIRDFINKEFFTETAKRIAISLYLR